MKLDRPDRNLTGMSILLNSDELASRVRPWLGEGKLELVNLRYKPETSCLATYRCQFNGQTTTVHAKAFDPLDWTIRKRKIPSEAYLDDEFSIAVFKFPCDAKLKGIEGLVHRTGPFLSRILFDNQPKRFVEGVNILAYKPNRRLVAVAHCENETRIVIKLHDKSTYRKALATAKAIQSNTINGIPVRIGRSKKHQAVAYEWIFGKPIDLQAITSQPDQVMDLVFGYLDQLHQSVAPEKIKLQVRSPLFGLDSISAYLQKICQPLCSLANSVLEQQKLLRPKNFSPRVVHGDFYHQQLVVQPTKLFALDFDHGCIADETTDLANFVAHLKLHNIQNSLSKSEFDTIEQLCLDHIENKYCDAARARFIWNYASGLFRLATHPFRQCRDNWQEEIESILRFAGNLSTLLNSTVSERGSSIEQGTNREQQSQQITSSIKSDSKFSRLADCFNPSKRQKLFSAQKENLQGLGERYICVDAIARRHKIGRRCVIEFEFATSRGKKVLLGKATAKRFRSRVIRAQKNCIATMVLTAIALTKSAFPKRMDFVDRCVCGSRKKSMPNQEAKS